MTTYDPRDMRFRNPSPLSLAGATTDEYAAEANAPQGVSVAQTTGGDDFYGEQLGALEQSLRGMPEQMRQYNDQRQGSYDQQIQAERDYMATLQQPERSQVMGRFGAALMAPTTTGSFFEGFGRATNAALDQRSLEDRARQATEEKLFYSRRALARLAGDRAVNPMDGMRDQFTMMKTANEVDGLRGDYDLQRDIGNGTTPQGDEALLADYRSNPNKYRSPRGQQMIADAQARASKASDRQWELDKMDRQSQLRQQEEAAKAAAAGSKPTPLDRSEASRVSKRLAETQSAADEASALKGDIANLRTSRDKTGYEGGWGADAYATAGGWLGLPGSSAMQEVRANAEQLRLALTQKTKGAISDSEMRIFGLATPGLNMGDEAAQSVLDAQEAAAERAVQRNMFLKAWVRANGNDYGSDEAWATYVAENPVISQDKAGNVLVDKSRISNWKNYITGPDGQPATGGQGQSGQPQGGQGGAQPQGLLVDPNTLPPNIKAWAEQQLRNGIPADQVIERINNHVRNKTGGQQ